MSDTGDPAQTRYLPGGVHRSVALWALTAVATLSFVDRQILAVLIEPIRADMRFSDTEFGMLTGLAFALFYALMGLPMAMIADRWHRVRLVALSCFIWSGFTAASGAAQNFVHLALARFGVGVGEAGGTAPSLSVLADYYPPERRTLIIAIYTASGPLGVFVGAAFGGWAAIHLGWRNAFYALGIFGLILAPIVWLCVREPLRGQMDHASHRDAAALPLADTLRLFVRQPSLRLLMLASGLSAFMSYGMLNWIPAFLMRVHAMPLEALATWFAPAAGGAMALGIFGGGAVVTRAVRRSVRAYALVPLGATLILLPSFAAALLVDSWQVALALMLLPMMCCTIYVAPSLALVANLTPPRARATASAMMLLVLNLTGQAAGPLFVGMVSDALAPGLAQDSLRIALLCLTPFGLIAALGYFAVSRHVAHDLATVDARPDDKPASRNGIATGERE
jgi:predicted MFS family arabinose efflux permease